MSYKVVYKWAGRVIGNKKEIKNMFKESEPMEPAVEVKSGAGLSRLWSIDMVG